MLLYCNVFLSLRYIDLRNFDDLFFVLLNWDDYLSISETDLILACLKWANNKVKQTVPEVSHYGLAAPTEASGDSASKSSTGIGIW